MKNNYSNVGGAWFYWTLAFVAVDIILIVFYHFHSGFDRTVLVAYDNASKHWVNGEQIYLVSSAGGFNYFIQAAILFIPFSLLPFKLGVIIWFLLNISMLFIGVLLVSKNFSYSKNSLFVFWMIISSLIVGFSSFRNGQANATIMIFTLFVVYCLQNKKDGWISFWLNLGLAIKPTMIILYLLVLGCRLRLWWKLLLGFIIMLAFPFITQSTGYVLDQYHQSWLNFVNTINIGVNSTNWASLFGALKAFNIGLTHTATNVVILVMALLTYVYAIYLYNRHDFKTWAWSLASMATIYLLLFNPRTENNGYVLIAPFLGYAIASAWQSKSFGKVIFLMFIGVLTALSYDISKSIIPGANSWVAPSATFLFAVYWVIFVDFKMFSLKNRT